MTTVRDDLVGLTTAIWESVLGMETFPVPPELVESALESEPTFIACVNITGGWDGSVAIVCPADLAEKVAGAMFGLGPDDLDEELVRDALGELANIAGGNVKGMIAEPCDLGLPLVADGNVTHPGASVVASCAFDCEGRPFAVVLHGSSPLPC